MCRWMAWLGQPVLMEELLFKTQHGLVDQSLHARMGAEPTNGDGFGLGWYGGGDGPGLYHSVSPAWADANLRELAGHIESPLFLAHIRATTGTAVQQTNCHPFRHGQWLFVHNGLIDRFDELRRELVMAVDPGLFADIQGSTDSEVLFHLALTFGLEDDPVGALERAIGFVESTARAHGFEPALQTSIGVSDGHRVWAVRYSSEGRTRTLFVSADAESVRGLHPGNARLRRLREGDRVVVSEPFSDLPGAWHEIPEATAPTVAPGGEVVPLPSNPGPHNQLTDLRGRNTGHGDDRRFFLSGGRMLPWVEGTLRGRSLTAFRAARLIALATLVLTVAGGVAVWLIDREDFATLGDGLWWSIQTVTTVGYGDVVAENTAGRLIGALLMLNGIAFLTVITATITALLIEQARRRVAEPERAMLAKLDEIESRLEGIEGRIGEGRKPPGR